MIYTVELRNYGRLCKKKLSMVQGRPGRGPGPGGASQVGRGRGPAGAGPQDTAGAAAPPGPGYLMSAGARGPAGANPGPRQAPADTNTKPFKISKGIYFLMGSL